MTASAETPPPAGPLENPDREVQRRLDPSTFDATLQALLKDPFRKLGSLPPGRAGSPQVADPAVLSAAWHEAEARRRSEAARGRAAELDARSKDREVQWRLQVTQRKEVERERRRQAEEEAAAATAEAPQPPSVAAPEDSSPLGQARAKWAAEAAARERERASTIVAQREQAQQWLDSDWAPALARQREDLRAKRQVEVQQKEQQLAEVRREMTAMGAEDRASRAFYAAAEAECARRTAAAAAPGPAQTEELARAMRRCQEEAQWRREREASDERAKKKQEEQEERRRWLEYREWREKVREERCCQQRIREREEPCDADLETIRKLELQGRDYYLEKQSQQRRTMEASLEHAALKTQSAREAGESPRRRLEDARQRAEQQKCFKAQQEPQKVEQELWDSMLAKNRLARTQDRAASGTVASTPRRWGAL